MSDEECPLCRFGDHSWRHALPQWIADLSVSCAVLSENQICRGYTIVVYTKGHVTELFHLKRKERIAYMEDVTRVAKAIDDAFHPHKLNYELLGNTVPHLHWHVIPRQKADPLKLQWPIWGKDYAEVTVSEGEYRQIAEKIREHL